LIHLLSDSSTFCAWRPVVHSFISLCPITDGLIMHLLLGWMFVFFPERSSYNGRCNEVLFSFLSGKNLLVELLDHMVNSILTCQKTIRLFSKVVVSFYIPSAVYLNFIHLLVNTWFVILFNFSHSNRLVVTFHGDLNLCFPNKHWCWASSSILICH
jgi:hypothetical protein